MGYEIVSFDGPQPVLVDPSTTAVRTTVDSVTSDTLLIAANPARKGLFIYNNSDSPLHVGLGTTPVSLTDGTLIISSHSGWNIPFNFTGEIRGIWEAATGDARITELT